MLFNSLEFLVFFPVFLLGYFCTSGRVRLRWMLVASLFFYGWWDWRYLILMVAVILGNYGFALRIDRSEDHVHRKRWLIATCVMNLGVLCFFKYFDFFIASVQLGLARLGIEVSD